MRGLEVAIPIPDLHHLYDVKPFHFLAHFLGHEGPGSLLSYLKTQGWVNSLRAGPSHEASGFGFFKTNVELTPDGLVHWKDVAMAIFKYMNLLRTTDPSETSFKEIAKLGAISYMFAERGKTRDYVSHLSNWMQAPVEREQIVSSNYLLGDFDSEMLTKTVQLLDPAHASIGVTTQELPKDVSFTFDQKEAIYGTEYHQERISKEFMQEAKSGKPIPALHLPGPNPFVPEKLDVEKFDVKQPTIRPELLRDSEVSRLWYKRDDRFWMPKTNVYVDLQSPLLDVTPRNAVLGRLLCDMFSDSITEEIYDAELAELSFGMWYAGDAICVNVGGFTDKLALLLEKMLRKFMDFEIDAERFDKVVDRTKLLWKNFALGEPYHVAHYWSSYVTTQVMWTQEEKLKEIERELFCVVSELTRRHQAGRRPGVWARARAATVRRDTDPRQHGRRGRQEHPGHARACPAPARPCAEREDGPPPSPPAPW